ncbi:hypothetical protein, conserved [Eimeria maxima]|uniref:Uncharacterized protein n=1 Tax=Eimeria maxima TaxID=5804 RepID=U6MCJ7_EIMMA|nr:hypothetical protein, conserved [Eimeria maxima]CDJ59390.1 hypothetical protein, conserved [Eimeria maxima]
MFFSSSRKQNETDSASAASPSGKQTPSSTDSSGIVGILLFNPTLLPEEYEQQEDEGSSPSDSKGSEDNEEEETGTYDGLTKEEREQEAKIVFSYPSDREPEERRCQAGLIEGLLMFIK